MVRPGRSWLGQFVLCSCQTLPITVSWEVNQVSLCLLNKGKSKLLSVSKYCGIFLTYAQAYLQVYSSVTAKRPSHDKWSFKISIQQMKNSWVKNNNVRETGSGDINSKKLGARLKWAHECFTGTLTPTCIRGCISSFDFVNYTILTIISKGVWSLCFLLVLYSPFILFLLTSQLAERQQFWFDTVY